jgi:hypothetical protein
MAVRLTASRAIHSLPHKKIPVTYFCESLIESKGHSAAGRIKQKKKTNIVKENGV